MQSSRDGDSRPHEGNEDWTMVNVANRVSELMENGAMSDISLPPLPPSIPSEDGHSCLNSSRTQSLEEERESKSSTPRSEQIDQSSSVLSHDDGDEDSSGNSDCTSGGSEETKAAGIENLSGSGREPRKEQGETQEVMSSESPSASEVMRSSTGSESEPVSPVYQQTPRSFAVNTAMEGRDYGGILRRMNRVDDTDAAGDSDAVVLNTIESTGPAPFSLEEITCIVSESASVASTPFRRSPGVGATDSTVSSSPNGTAVELAAAYPSNGDMQPVRSAPSDTSTTRSVGHASDGQSPVSYESLTRVASNGSGTGSGFGRGGWPAAIEASDFTPVQSMMSGSMAGYSMPPSASRASSLIGLPAYTAAILEARTEAAEEQGIFWQERARVAEERNAVLTKKIAALLALTPTTPNSSLVGNAQHEGSLEEEKNPAENGGVVSSPTQSVRGDNVVCEGRGGGRDYEAEGVHESGQDKSETLDQPQLQPYGAIGEPPGCEQSVSAQTSPGIGDALEINSAAQGASAARNDSLGGITFTDFSVGRVAMFFPTPEGNFLAFNVGRPGHFLSKESQQLVGRDPHFRSYYVLGRVIEIQDIVCEPGNPYNLPAGQAIKLVFVESIAPDLRAAALTNQSSRPEKRSGQRNPRVNMKRPLWRKMVR